MRMISPSMWRETQVLFELGKPLDYISELMGISKNHIRKKSKEQGWKNPNIDNITRICKCGESFITDKIKDHVACYKCRKQIEKELGYDLVGSIQYDKLDDTYKLSDFSLLRNTKNKPSVDKNNQA